jgi:hypothetical protein
LSQKDIKALVFHDLDSVKCLYSKKFGVIKKQSMGEVYPFNKNGAVSSNYGIVSLKKLQIFHLENLILPDKT